MFFSLVISSLTNIAYASTESIPSTTSGHLGFPIDTVAIFLAAFVFSLWIDYREHKNATEISLASATKWSVFWIMLSMGFYGWIFYDHGAHYANMFLSGYILEKTLSVDNLMVFMAIFQFFNIKDTLQHKILYFGILGAIIFRGIFVGLGSLLLHFSGWAELIFGLLVGYAGVMMLAHSGDEEEEEEPDYENMLLVRMFRKIYPIYPDLVEDKLFVSKEEATSLASKNSITLTGSAPWFMTPAFVCLLVVEGSDVLFAVDSVPAVIAVTAEPLLVYSAMIFAILGLRSLYFVLTALTKYLVYLERAVVVVLFFIAFKMFSHAYDVFTGNHFLDISPTHSVMVVLGILGIGILASVLFPPKEDSTEEKKD